LARHSVNTAVEMLMVDEQEACCFICLGGDNPEGLEGPLLRQCNCPSLFSHTQCMIRWQLQNAGKAEESECRFCRTTLKDWRKGFSEMLPLQPAQVQPAPPVMAVVFRGRTIKVPLIHCEGPDGVAESQAKFKRTVCTLFNLPQGTEFEVSFDCKTPVGDRMNLRGFKCFEAATYCAAASASRRGSSSGASHLSASSAQPKAPASTTTAAGARRGHHQGHYFSGPLIEEDNMQPRPPIGLLPADSLPLCSVSRPGRVFMGWLDKLHRMCKRSE